MAPAGRISTFGASVAMSAIVVKLRASIISALTLVIATGTFCKFCWRNSAVTTISPKLEFASGEGDAGVDCA